MGTNLGTNDLADWVNRAYFNSAPTATLGFTGFTYTSTTQYDSADIEMRDAGSQPFIMWSLGRLTNSNNITAATITGPGMTTANITDFPTADNTSTNATISNASFNSTFSTLTATTAVITFSATDAIGKSVAKTLNLNFRWKRYYGFIAHPGTPSTSNGTDFDDEYFIYNGSVPTRDLINSMAGDFNGDSRIISERTVVNETATPKRLIVAIPDGWTTGARIYVNGFDVTDQHVSAQV